MAKPTHLYVLSIEESDVVDASEKAKAINCKGLLNDYPTDTRRYNPDKEEIIKVALGLSDISDKLMPFDSVQPEGANDNQ